MVRNDAYSTYGEICGDPTIFLTAFFGEIGRQSGITLNSVCGYDVSSRQIWSAEPWQRAFFVSGVGR
jgi:hypothetical protein